MEKKRVLIIKIAAIGDAVHSSIVATAIKQKHPDWEVDFLTHTGLSQILENSDIDNVVCWDDSKKKSFKYLLALGKELRARHYDSVINLSLSIRSCILSILAMPRKISNKKNLGGLWVEDYFMAAKGVYRDIEMPQNLHLVCNKEVEKEIKKELEKYPRPYFVITPGGRSDKFRQGRIWNIAKWKELVFKINQKYNGTVFVCGGETEVSLHENLSDAGVVLLSGKYSLTQSAALFSNVDLVISGDSGPVHLASALDTKTLALLGSTSPEQIKPYGEKGYYISAEYDCLYCWEKKCKKLKRGEIYTPCMEALLVDDVVNKIEEILD